MVKVYERILRPEPAAQFLTRHQLIRGMFNEQYQNSQRLFAQFDSQPELPQFSCAEVHLVGTKAGDAQDCGRSGHRNVNAPEGKSDDCGRTSGCLLDQSLSSAMPRKCQQINGLRGDVDRLKR